MIQNIGIRIIYLNDLKNLKDLSVILSVAKNLQAKLLLFTDPSLRSG